MGPDGDFRRVNSPLISELLENTVARPDELALGLDVADDGALVDSTGVASTFLFALGPLRKVARGLQLENCSLFNVLTSSESGPFF